jgi:hypothetical protein
MAQNLRLVRSRAGPVPIALRRSGSSNSGSLAYGWSPFVVQRTSPWSRRLQLLLNRRNPNFGDGPPISLVSFFVQQKSAKWIEMADFQWNDRCDIPPMPSLAINAESFEPWCLSVTVRERPLRFRGTELPIFACFNKVKCFGLSFWAERPPKSKMFETSLSKFWQVQLVKRLR